MRGKVVARYVYESAKGEPRLRKLRFDPKAFRMQSWLLCGTETDEPYWSWLNGVSPERYGFWIQAMYRLPELVAALRVDVPIYWCEGEKDADLLAGLGLTATTTPNPSELWDDQALWFTKYRSQSKVMVVCDADMHGGWWGWERYQALLRVGVAADRIHVVAPPYGSKDVSEAAEAGRDPTVMRSVSLGRLEKVAGRYSAERARRYAS